jgi:hypothetical protein
MIFKASFVAILSAATVANGFVPRRPLAISGGGGCVDMFGSYVDQFGRRLPTVKIKF